MPGEQANISCNHARGLMYVQILVAVMRVTAVNARLLCNGHMQTCLCAKALL